MSELMLAFIEEYSKALEFLVREQGWTGPEIEHSPTFCKILYRKVNLAVEVTLDIPALDVSVYFTDTERASIPGVWKIDSQGKRVRVELWKLLMQLGLFRDVIKSLPVPDNPKIWQDASRTRQVEACRMWFRVDAMKLSTILKQHGLLLLKEATSMLGD